MATIFASGCAAWPFFIFKGKRVSYRVIERIGKEIVESLLECLLRGSIVTTRDDVAGVDKQNFIR